MVALGQSMLGGVDPADMVEPELVEFPTFDGKMIPAWLYKPQNMAAGCVTRWCSLFMAGQKRRNAPCITTTASTSTGSTGDLASLPLTFGFQRLRHQLPEAHPPRLGGDELKDIDHAARYLQGQDWVDKNRIAVFGGSFGGFATLSAVTRLPEYWAAAVDIVGPSNLVTFAKSVPEFWKPIMKSWVGDPEEDHDMLMERSPITYVDHIKAPMLVIQGANDRVSSKRKRPDGRAHPRQRRRCALLRR